MNVAIFGFMGVGKSSVGRLLAENLGMGFVDIDDAIVEDAGMNIPSIFKEQGEKGFRELEKAVTQKVSEMDGVVIACGGGTVLDEENLSALRRNSRMILLIADPETILARVQADGDTRPLLNNDGKGDPVSLLLRVRIPKYLKAAEYIVNTSGKTLAKVAQEIEKYLKEVR